MENDSTLTTTDDRPPAGPNERRAIARSLETRVDTLEAELRHTRRRALRDAAIHRSQVVALEAVVCFLIAESELSQHPRELERYRRVRRIQEYRPRLPRIDRELLGWTDESPPDGGTS